MTQKRHFLPSVAFPLPQIPCLWNLGEAGRGLALAIDEFMPKIASQKSELTMPPRQSTPKIQRRAAELRHNQTEAESKLWQALRAHQTEDVHFRRQHAIGSYIVDFCAVRRKLIIELDGSQHLEQAEYDQQRSEFLQSKGYRVLRFWNHDVMNDLNGVIGVIQDALENNK